jgi:hypothetical protein
MVFCVAFGTNSLKRFYDDILRQEILFGGYTNLNMNQERV